MRAREQAAMARVRLDTLVCTIAFAATLAVSTRATLAQTSPTPPAAAASQDPFPESSGRTALLKICSNCHTAETVIQSVRTRQEWSDVIDQMARFGAEASDKEFDQILTYLARHFSPIKINIATAKDLESTLDVAPAVAEDIVSYRAKNGEFKSLDDLKKVPTLKAERIDAVKSRIVF
jgi:competence protein ComEA